MVTIPQRSFPQPRLMQYTKYKKKICEEDTHICLNGGRRCWFPNTSIEYAKELNKLQGKKGKRKENGSNVYCKDFTGHK